VQPAPDDTQLIIAVSRALADDPRTHLATTRVVVHCTDAMVTLDGQVPDEITRSLMTDVARGVPGVRAVINRLVYYY
jgi:osmotically-inducible protein OsmY